MNLPQSVSWPVVAALAPELMWLLGAFIGYVLVMVFNPSRGYFTDGFNLLRERGQVRLWLPIIVLSLLPLLPVIWLPDTNEQARAIGVRGGMEMAKATSEDTAGLFGAVSRTRFAESARSFDARTKAALSIGALFIAALVICMQFVTLVGFYLGILMPERDPGWGGLLSFAWRRLLRFWPGVLLLAGFTALPLWLPIGGTADVFLWPIAALLAIVFAFVQVALLSGERGLRAAVAANFQYWRTLGYGVFWFIAVAVVNVFLLHNADAVVVGVTTDTTIGRWVWNIVFAVLRAALLGWLLASWVLHYCATTKNPTRRKIKP